MRTAVCTGSFDPPTLGHMDIFMRAAELFDMVYVAVLTNPNKKPVFTADERCGLLMDCLLYTSPSPRDGLLSRMPSSA